MAISNLNGAALEQQAAILDARNAKSTMLSLDVMGKRLPGEAKGGAPGGLGDGAIVSPEASAPVAPTAGPNLGALQQNFA